MKSLDKYEDLTTLGSLFLEGEALTHPEGTWWLYNRAKELGPEGVVIEVGTWCGWTAAVLALGGPKVICIDTFMMSDPFTKPSATLLRKRGERHGTLDRHALHLIELGLGERVATVQAKSVEAAQAMGRGIADFIFLDADHAYQEVINDLIAWEPVLKPGGLLCGDNWDSVKDVQKAVQYILKSTFTTWPEARKVANDIWVVEKPNTEGGK